MRYSALILSIGGTLSAIVGSVGVGYAAWAARLMLTCNIIVIATFVAHVAARKRNDNG